jgi:hypothetical protein
MYFVNVSLNSSGGKLTHDGSEDQKLFHNIQPAPELPPCRKQACANSKRDSKMIKINFLEAHIKFSISAPPHDY